MEKMISPSSIWKKIKNEVVKYLKGEAVKLALKKILGSVMASGPVSWLVTYLAEHFYDEIAAPIIKASFNQMGYYYNKAEGKIYIKKIRESENEIEYNSAIDDIFDR